MDKTVAMTCGELAILAGGQPPDRLVAMEGHTGGAELLTAASEAMYYLDNDNAGNVANTPEVLADLRERGVPGWEDPDNDPPDDAVRVLVLDFNAWERP